ncbi:hypothetical protein SERLA73DRAFT_160331 [Serpula lacrymans var. lacrymans S7.3]|uniref:NACHT domain-containing protein n=1 Tax=Serpula lacrymans var. lacrymans (strain S7.3) TaxID=936435 RepID=F8PUS3_SERL3|nr:hypothetical protein SERLA73DRAFT_160331 [Serpula lacrymans var. lacrymans S7.3]
MHLVNRPGWPVATVDARGSAFNEIHGHGKQINNHINSNAAITQFFAPLTVPDPPELAEWLSPLNFRQTHSEIYGSRREGTGEWVLEDERFQDWKKGKTKTLWCPGIPGAGKTVLASYIIDHLRRNEVDGVAVAYLYCNYKDQALQTVYNLVAYLLKQLVQDFPTTSERVTKHYERHLAQNYRPTLHDVHSTLITEIQQFSQVFIIIDALDEIPEDGDIRSELLHRLQSLGGSLLVTSRDNASIAAALRDAQLMDISAHEGDIREYIEGCIHSGTRLTRLDRLLAEDPVLREEIFRRIIEVARGMFLLCRLHMDSLAKKTTRKEIRLALESLPQGVNSAYDETMKRIHELDEKHQILAIEAIVLITYASHPLTIKELQQALACSDDLSSADDENLVDPSLITDICLGLVVEKESKFHLVRLALHGPSFRSYQDLLTSSPITVRKYG